MSWLLDWHPGARASTWLEHPAASLPLACLLVLVGTLWLLSFLAARRRTSRLLGAPPQGRGFGPEGRAARGLRELALFLALCLIALALLGPRLGSRRVALSSEGIDVVFLLDVSRSMDTMDTPPSRLDRARALAARTLAGLAPGDRAALAAFAGRGVLLTPLSHDTDALARMLPALDSTLIRPGGSNLDDGLRAATEAFSDERARARMIVLLSDGEAFDAPNATGGWRAASRESGLEAAMRRGVRVHAVGIGSDAGASVPDHGAWLRDVDGRIVVSRRHPTRLERQSSMTGGVLLLADAWGEVESGALLSRLRVGDGGARTAGDGPASEGVFEVRAAPLFTPFVAAAALLLWLEAWPIRAGNRRPRAAAPPLSLSLLLVALASWAAFQLTPGKTRADDAHAELPHGLRSESALDHLALGLRLLDANQPEEARLRFLATAVLSDDPTVGAIARHDLGVLALQRGELAAALAAFRDALALQPEVRETRFNFEWTLRALGQSASLPVPGPLPDEKPLQSSREPDPSRPARPPTTVSDGGDDGGARTGAVVRAGADPGEAKGRSPRLPTALSPAEREQWLARVRDDPGRILGAAVREDGSDSRRLGAGRQPQRAGRGPAW